MGSMDGANVAYAASQIEQVYRGQQQGENGNSVNGLLMPLLNSHKGIFSPTSSF